MHSFRQEPSTLSSSYHCHSIWGLRHFLQHPLHRPLQAGTSTWPCIHPCRCSRKHLIHKPIARMILIYRPIALHLHDLAPRRSRFPAYFQAKTARRPVSFHRWVRFPWLLSSYHCQRNHHGKDVERISEGGANDLHLSALDGLLVSPSCLL